VSIIGEPGEAVHHRFNRNRKGIIARVRHMSGPGGNGSERWFEVLWLTDSTGAHIDDPEERSWHWPTMLRPIQCPIEALSLLGRSDA
jgi:hypothetical protein